MGINSTGPWGLISRFWLTWFRNVGLVIGSPLGGWFSDRVLRLRKKVVLVGLTMMTLIFWALGTGWGDASLMILAGLLLAFGFFGAFGIVLYTHTKELISVAISGTALIGVNCFTMLGGAARLHGLGPGSSEHWDRPRQPGLPAGFPFVRCRRGPRLHGLPLGHRHLPLTHVSLRNSLE